MRTQCPSGGALPHLPALPLGVGGPSSGPETRNREEGGRGRQPGWPQAAGSSRHPSSPAARPPQRRARCLQTGFGAGCCPEVGVLRQASLFVTGARLLSENLPPGPDVQRSQLWGRAGGGPPGGGTAGTAGPPPRARGSVPGSVSSVGSLGRPSCQHRLRGGRGQKPGNCWPWTGSHLRLTL